MKKVILRELSLTNWKGERQRTTSFNEAETTICGENGLGKTRHFDAFMWLLFGKDSQDRKDYNIKSIVDGKPLEKVTCEVVGVLDVDGEQITLRRAYVEDWVKPRGQVEQVFKGNRTETYYNDTPVNVSEYQNRINAIIDDTVFKMITNPLFFASMKWQDQREQLFSLAGTITDGEIAAGNADYSALLDKIAGKSLADFKREIASRKKKLKEDLGNIQPRIDQTTRLMPSDVDYSALSVELEGVEKSIAQVDESIADTTKAIRQQYEGVQAKQKQINELKQNRQNVLFEAQNLAREEAFKAIASRREIESNIKVCQQELASMQRSIQSLERELASLQNQVAAKRKEVEQIRNDWYAENARAFVESSTDIICPLFDFVCKSPEATQKREQADAKAKQIFAEAKTNKLNDLNKKGCDMSKEIEVLEQSIKEAEASLGTARNELSEKQKELMELQGKLEKQGTVAESEVNPDSLPQYVQLSNDIKKLEATLDENTEQVDTTELQSKKKGLQTQRDALKEKLGGKTLKEKYTVEITNLEEQGRDLAQQLADLEREEYVMQNFTKAKIEECERRINGLFSFVKFKLFDYTIDGNESETCIALVDGVPFPSVNTAGKVNAGLDIINALARYYGIAAPIFIDGRESVNRLIETESQIINLVVSHDKELIIK